MQPFDDNLVRQFCVCKSFKENEAKTNSLSFAWDGLSLVASTDDDQVCIIEIEVIYF
jgi:hypothetical protein